MSIDCFWSVLYVFSSDRLVEKSNDELKGFRGYSKGRVFCVNFPLFDKGSDEFYDGGLRCGKSFESDFIFFIVYLFFIYSWNRMIDPQIESSRKEILWDEFQKPYFMQIKNFLQKEKAEGKTIYPAGNQIFNAFDKTPFDKVKVVIIGQDPYHGEGEAHGLCFSVQDGVSIPPSLRNIYKEMNLDLGLTPPKSGNLMKWTQEGVFLLNATLTVRKDTPNSHKDIGWQIFTDAVIKILSEKKKHLVFILWGAFAQQKKNLIDESKHLVICSAHPSPFSADRGFFGSKPFSRTNEYLEKNGITPINWDLN